jgi:hypothetical protein
VTVVATRVPYGTSVMYEQWLLGGGEDAATAAATSVPSTAYPASLGWNPSEEKVDVPENLSSVLVAERLKGA